MRESRYWILFLASGVLMIVLLGIHLFLMHFGALAAYFGGSSEPLQFSAVIARSNSITWKVTYMVLLILALYHSLYGLRSIVLEVVNHPVGERVLSWLILCVGVAALVYGGYAIILA